LTNRARVGGQASSCTPEDWSQYESWTLDNSRTLYSGPDAVNLTMVMMIKIMMMMMMMIMMMMIMMMMMTMMMMMRRRKKEEDDMMMMMRAGRSTTAARSTPGPTPPPPWCANSRLMAKWCNDSEHPCPMLILC
jgi:hypothetical protein